jgi:hypothetical protein
MQGPGPGRALNHLEVVAIADRLGKHLLVGDEDDPSQPAPQGVVRKQLNKIPCDFPGFFGPGF